MKSTVDNYEEKHKKTLLTTCREYKSTRREGNGINLRSEKLKRIKIQVMPLAPVA